MDRREREALDRHITGNYGEDQFKDDEGEALAILKAEQKVERQARVLVEARTILESIATDPDLWGTEVRGLAYLGESILFDVFNAGTHTAKPHPVLQAALTFTQDAADERRREREARS